MMKNKSEDKKRDHADFQDSYRRSSNFSQINEDETDELVIEGDGEVQIKSGKDNVTDKEKIKDALDLLEDEEE